MKTLLCLIVAAGTVTLQAEKIALVGGTVINPATEVVLTGARVLIDNDRITGLGDDKTLDLPKDARQIDCKGKFLLPGYVDTHIHFFQSGDLFTRPDVVDLTNVRPYRTKSPGSSRISTTRLRVISVVASRVWSMWADHFGILKCANARIRPRKRRA